MLNAVTLSVAAPEAHPILLCQSVSDNVNKFNFVALGLFEAPERVSTEDAGQVAQVLGMFSDAQSVINSQTSWYQIG